MVGRMDPSAQVFLAQLELMQARAEHAQRQITSGKKLVSPSDGPDEVSAILQLRSELQRNEQIKTNLVRVRSEVETADGVLQRALTVLDRAIVLAGQGAGGLIGADQRRVLAEEVSAIQEEMVGLSQATSEGRFIFGGDQDGEPGYRIDLASPTGVERLVPFQAATRQVIHPSGTTFGVARTAQEIFDERNADDTPSTRNVFAAINALRVALAGNDEAGVDASVVALREVSGHLNAQLGFYGGVENRIAEAVADASNIGLRLKTTLSELEDADVTAAILELNQVELNQRAALSSRSLINRSSLFDYLK